MILACEPVCHGHEHVPFNLGFLATILAARPGETVTFLGEDRHLDALRRELPPLLAPRVAWRRVPLPPRHAAFRQRLRPEFQLMRRLCREGRRGPASLVLTNALPSTLLAFKAAAAGTGARGQVVLHGILASLQGWRARNPLVRLQQLDTALRCPPNRRVQYIFLEESIPSTLAAVRPDCRLPCTALVEHPIVTEPDAPSDQAPRLPAEGPLRIGFLGLATPHKGYDRFLRLAAETARRRPGRVEFHVVGRRPAGGDGTAAGLLATPPVQHRLERPEFVRRVMDLHYICLPFAGAHYHLSPSGVLLDAIAFTRPVIAAGIPLVESLFRRYGDIGCLCRAEDDFLAAVEDLCDRPDPARYARQVTNLGRARQDRRPENQALRYREACRRFFGP